MPSGSIRTRGEAWWLPLIGVIGIEGFGLAARPELGSGMRAYSLLIGRRRAYRGRCLCCIVVVGTREPLVCLWITGL